ncbi:hypothetical protein ACFSUK_07975 [Sphingobium scionense]
MLDSNEGTALLRADGSTLALRCIGVDPVSNNRVYVAESAI